MINAVLLVAVLVSQPEFVEWKAVRPPKNDSVLEDILSHSRQGDRMLRKYWPDLLTAGHETTHFINADIGNSTSSVYQGLYVLENRAVFLKRPTWFKLRDVYVEPELRGEIYKTYLIDAARDPHNNNNPFFLLDEWVAYTNEVAVWQNYRMGNKDAYVINRSLEMTNYVIAMRFWLSVPPRPPKGVIPNMAMNSSMYREHRTTHAVTLEQFDVFFKWNQERIRAYSAGWNAPHYPNKLRKTNLSKFAEMWFGIEWCQQYLFHKEVSE